MTSSSVKPHSSSGPRIRILLLFGCLLCISLVMGSHDVLNHYHGDDHTENAICRDKSLNTDIVLLIDRSRSIGLTEFNRMKVFISHFMSQFRSSAEGQSAGGSSAGRRYMGLRPSGLRSSEGRSSGGRYTGAYYQGEEQQYDRAGRREFFDRRDDRVGEKLTGVRVAVISFGETTTVDLGLDEFRSADQVSRTVNELDVRVNGGRTLTRAAFGAVEHVIKPHGTEPKDVYCEKAEVILFSDGMPHQRDVTRVRIAAFKKRFPKVVVSTIGMGETINESDLKYVATTPNRFYRLGDFQLYTTSASYQLSYGQRYHNGTVDRITGRIITDFCSREEDPRFFFEECDGIPHRPSATLPPTVTPIKPLRCGTVPTRIVFVPGSLSKHAGDGQQILKFLHTLATQPLILPPTVRLGLIPATCQGTSGFNLEGDKQWVLSAIQTSLDGFPQRTHELLEEAAQIAYSGLPYTGYRIPDTDTGYRKEDEYRQRSSDRSLYSSFSQRFSGRRDSHYDDPKVVVVLVLSHTLDAHDLRATITVANKLHARQAALVVIGAHKYSKEQAELIATPGKVVHISASMQFHSASYKEEDHTFRSLADSFSYYGYTRRSSRRQAEGRARYGDTARVYQGKTNGDGFQQVYAGWGRLLEYSFISHLEEILEVLCVTNLYGKSRRLTKAE